MKRRIGSLVTVSTRLLVLPVSLLLASCATGVRVTGSLDQGDTRLYSQAETAATRSIVNGDTVLAVFFNDLTDPGGKVMFTPTTRVVKSDFSLFGWSYSLDLGATWVYVGKVAAPPDWPIIWGDPSATSSPLDDGVVFATQLALPVSKVPAAGIGGNMYTGGACIFRSLDGGRTFAVHQCVSNADPIAGRADSALGHFYDGSSIVMAADGSVIAAYYDTYNPGVYDLWRSVSKDGAFSRIANPFPGNDMAWHPRLRAHPQDGSVYILGQRPDGQVWINRYKDGAWGQQRAVTPPVPTGSTTVAGLAMGQFCLRFSGTGLCDPANELGLRTGNQFSFDIGVADDPQGRDAIRVLYTTYDRTTRRFGLASSTCDIDLVSCYTWQGASDWGISPPQESNTDYFNPLVRFWPGRGRTRPVWMTSFSRRATYPATDIHVLSARLEYQPGTATRLFDPHAQSDAMPVCPDHRGYWGDYDDLVLAEVRVKPDDTPPASPPTPIVARIPAFEPRWLRTVTDSRPGCSSRWQYIAVPVHVTALLFQ